MRMMYHITSTNNNTLVTEVAVPLKCLSNFRRSLDLILIDFEIEHHLLGQKISYYLKNLILLK